MVAHRLLHPRELLIVHLQLRAHRCIASALRSQSVEILL